MSHYWEGERVLLRGTEPQDWEAFSRFDRVSEDLRSMHRLYPPRSETSYRKMFAENAEKTPVSDEFGLVVCSAADGEVVGSIATQDCDQTAGTFSFGISIGRDHQRNGYAAEAVVLVLGFMFGERRYQKCNSGAYDFNAASVALHHKLGFQVEGRIRQNSFLAGRYYDDLLFGMTVQEFAERYPFPSI